MQCVKRRLEEARAHWRAAVRGLPRPDELTALPRQRFDAVDKRLSRALMANTQAHAKRLAHISPRLQPRLLTGRIEREHIRLERFASKATDALARRTSARRLHLTRISGRLDPARTAERISRAAERLISLDHRQKSAFEGILERRRQRLEAQGQMLASLSYHSVVGRGFALIRDTSGRAVRSAAALDVGASIDIELADGHVGAIVSDRDPVVRESSSEEATARHRPPADLRIRPSPRRRSSDRGAGGQGSLF